MARIVIAPDSFKGSVPAAEAARSIARGWRLVRPGDEVLTVPMADGGEGTLDAVQRAVPGAVRRPVRVPGPDGRDHDAHWLRLPDGRGVVELAETSGLGLLRAALPLDAHTEGFGRAIAASLDEGMTGLVLAIGGSASTDGGVGLLRALGARFTDAGGAPIGPGSRGLAELATADVADLRPPPRDGAIVLTDVRSPLHGPLGAAAVFGPQKGADPSDIPGMDVGLVRLARLLGGDPDAEGAGAAGGAGFALARWGAVLVPGAPAIAALIGLPASLAGADLVITGEGRFDSTSMRGKVVGTVLELARDHGLRIALVAGGISDDAPPFAASVSLETLAGSRAQALAAPGPLLARAGALLAERLGG